MEALTDSPPRENLYRASKPGLEMREDSEGGMPTLFGHFAVFNRWTEINDLFEGNFMERFSPGAFKKTISERMNDVKVLFQHGHDPQIGDKPLGTVDVIEEDDIGARYEVPLLDTQYVREVVPGLEAGVYGASFRFSVVKEDIDKEPDPSESNPEGIPERTVKEAKLYEFSPVTFPAYADATAGVRSMSQDFNIFEQLGRDPERARELLFTGTAISRALITPPPGDDAAPLMTGTAVFEGRTSSQGRRVQLAPERATLTPKEQLWKLP